MDPESDPDPMKRKFLDLNPDSNPMKCKFLDLNVIASGSGSYPTICTDGTGDGETVAADR